jgi:hypothetical protein
MTKAAPPTLDEMRAVFIRMVESYSAFQRTRPDLPQGDIWRLSKRDLKKVMVAFDLEKARPLLEKSTLKRRKRLERAIRTGILEFDAE